MRIFIFAAVIALFSTAALAAEDLTSVQADFLQGRYERVIGRTRELLARGGSNRRASSGRQDELLYLQGVSALKLRDMELAQTSLRRILSDYPTSRFSGQATAALQGASRPSEAGYFSVQLGAFETKSNADRLKTELERRGYSAEVNDMVAEGRRLYRVRAGRFASRSEAETENRRLKGDGFPGEVVP